MTDRSRSKLDFGHSKSDLARFDTKAPLWLEKLWLLVFGRAIDRKRWGHCGAASGWSLARCGQW